MPTFRALLSTVAQDAVDVHLVDEDLLADAGRHGVDDGLQARLLARMQALAERAPDVILCTCSTFGGHAEQLAGRLGVPVVRIDRPLAERAVAGGGRVAVVAAVEATLGPTRELFEACAASANTGAILVDAPCLDAWPLFEAGDHAGYHDRIARHVRDLADTIEVDVVVLAQASMAPTAALLRDLAIPVLCSPALAVARAVEIAAAAAPPS